MGVPTVSEASNPRWGTLLLAIFLAASRGLATAFKVATPYSLYVCPEGQNATLTCRILGSVSKGHDVTFYKTWYLSSRGEVQVCKEHRPIRNFTGQHHHQHHGSHLAANASHDQAQTHGLELASDHHGNFSITLHNVTLRDSGVYCCLVIEVKHRHPEQRFYGYMELQVQAGKGSASTCTAYRSNEQDSDSAQELVRMDSSNTQGIENPGYETTPPFQGMPEAKTRPPLSYVAQRQPSESGRHLLSNPSTPLSPPGPGDVFFPSLDPVPDSPNSDAI
ncbi:V-type immunoglobulin domain-containing suppressor of T-cell activation isoform X3 [Grammomys surdaster]|uniref:V-type immunoglobulin domain-containing suppressor of T-cell activation isoform X3 n=1 Tax=Grammomys surdaster TaxID=491861 RepID=UPI00109FFA06|nr:V-type immunoglobulin domain-containing suppressor of T-cell activation isoform X3 [Grammomys surdaster]